MTADHASIDWSLPRWQIGRPDYCNKCICNKCKSKNCQPCKTCKEQPIENCKEYEGIKTNPTAKEMFEALRYVYESDDTRVWYYNGRQTLVFYIQDKNLYIDSPYMVRLSNELLKAIYKQREELKW